LDPNFPAERLAFMIEDARPVVLVTQQKLRDTLPPHKSQVLCIDSIVPELNPKAEIQSPKSSDLAYVLYTSGSTGKPKGVQITHRAVVNFLTSMQREPGLTAADVLVAVTTLSFDIAGLELYLPLVTGARVVIASREAAADAAQLVKLLQDSHATVLQATPVTWRMLLATGWKGEPKLKVLCGGEALPAELAEQLTQCSPEVWNLYGPTETTIWSAVSRILPGQPVRVGRPIANTQFYVLDPQMQPVPVGVPGELLIGGDGVAQGYLNRPELTAEKFIANPFRPGERIYRTGDLVRYRTDGTLEFLGRLDQQVKVRGFRIELGEIETALGQHPEVRQAVVIAREDKPGDKRLAAYLQLKNGHDVPANEFREFLRERLPDYMVPAAIVRMKTLPLTPNGKVDRKALPAPEEFGMESGTKFVAPRDELEEQLAKLWAEIFQRQPIGVQDNFFDLGGHSLLAVRLFAQVEKLTGKNLPLVTLFQAPTIEQLAAVLREQGWEAPWSSLVPIKAGGTKLPFYCVHGVGGNILEYLDLAKYIEDDQPFYGIQAVGLDGKRPWLKTVGEMAEHYIKEIRAFQPVGPYYLGGSSYGGIVAYEMAQRLQQAGERVALLAFFDTAGPGYPEFLSTTSRWQKRLNHLQYRASLHWGNFRASTGRQKWEYIREKAKRAQFRVVWHVKRIRRRWEKRWTEMSLPKAIVQTKKSTEDAVSRYVFQPYPGSAVLFRAMQQPPGIRYDRSLGWAPYVQGGLEIHDTPGHHGAIVREPRSRVLAQQLQDCLRRIQAEEKVEMAVTR
jgi:amino acid adenylation domain-containing protein